MRRQCGYFDYGKTRCEGEAITLESDPAEAVYGWSKTPAISDEEIIKQTGYDQGLKDEILESRNYQTWRFEAVRSGISTISLEYRTSGDPASQAEDYYTLTVKVR